MAAPNTQTTPNEPKPRPSNRQRYYFPGPNGMAAKMQTLSLNCRMAMTGLPRTMIFAVSCPDPTSTPGAMNAGPQGVRLLGLDDDIKINDMATLIGMMYGYLDNFEDYHTIEFGEKFRESVDLARSTYGHSVSMKSVIVEPQNLADKTSS